MSWNKNKYRNTWVECDGIRFHSKAERDFYIVLKNLESIGAVKLLELQPKVYMTDAKILYKPDFLIEEKDQLVYVDVKGMETPVFKIKKKLWKFYGNGKLRLVKKSGNRFKTLEEIES